MESGATTKRRGGEPAPVGAACSGAAEPVGRSSSQDGGSSRDTRPGIQHDPARPFQVGEVPRPRSPLLNGANGSSRSPLATRPARVNSQAAVRCPSWWHLAEALSASQAASSLQTQSKRACSGLAARHLHGSVRGHLLLHTQPTAPSTSASTSSTATALSTAP